MKFCKLLRFFNHICKQILQKQKRKNSHVYVTSSHQRCSVKKSVLKNFSNFKGRHLCWSLFFTKSKRDFNADIFCENWEVYKNTYFEEHLLVG